MILSIDDLKTILDVQERFNMCFPYLKIEFYEEPERGAGVPAYRHPIHSSFRIGSIRTRHDPGLLDIKSYYTTGRVEQDFREHCGLNVQIFRLENNRWIRTDRTGEHTLKEQSDKAVYHTLSFRPSVAGERIRTGPVEV